MRNPNKRRSKFLGVVILCLSLVASGLIGAGIAKYISSITGSSNANVAIWSVEINDQQIASPDAQTFTFQMQNQEVAVVIDVELTVNQYFPCLDSPDASLLSVAEITESSVALQAIDGAEYSMDDETWQGSTVFEDLNPGEEYTFYVRYKETYVASASTSVSFTQKTKTL